MVGMLRGFDIMQITNIKIRQIEDSIVSHLARIANVPIRICDPGNLHENKPRRMIKQTNRISVKLQKLGQGVIGWL